MPTFLAELLAQMRAIWKRLDAGQRTVVVAVMLGTIAGLGALVVWAGRPDYQVVLTSDDAREFTKATAALEQRNFSYQLDGRSILVEASHSREARAALFAAGVTGGDGGDATEGLGGITMDSQSKAFLLDQQKRKQAERAVRELHGVTSVVISFSKPKRALYANLDSETTPRASVTLGIAAGESFRKIARGVVPVASSALAVPPEQVTVINIRTAETYRPDLEHGGDALDTGDFLAMQERRAAELCEKAQHLLEATYPGQVRVVVNVELDPLFDFQKKTLVPESPLLRSEKTSRQETGGNTGGGTTGDPSTTAAVSGSANVSGGNGGGNGNKNETKDREYETSLGTSQTGKWAPDIRKLSVALVIDEAVPTDPQKLEKIVGIVKSAVGWDQDRDGKNGDVSILVDKFKPLPEAPAESGPGVLGMVQEFGPAVGQVVAVVLVLLFLRGLLRRSQRPLPARAPARGPGATAVAADATPLTPQDEVKRARKEIEQSIAADPASISRLIEGWLAEQRT